MSGNIAEPKQNLHFIYPFKSIGTGQIAYWSE